jgi:hypothetical protein
MLAVKHRADDDDAGVAGIEEWRQKTSPTTMMPA